VGSDCKIIVPALWERFVIHFAAPGKLKDRIIAIPDTGMNIQLGGTVLKAIPAHFRHSEGNFQFYDLSSQILFSGDMGASLNVESASQPVDDFDSHIGNMENLQHGKFPSSLYVKQQSLPLLG